MDSRTGDLYPSWESAVAAGVPARDVVEVKGAAPAVKRVAKACKDAFKRRRARQRMQRKSRRRNRR